jgi:hypothetical protein
VERSGLNNAALQSSLRLNSEVAEKKHFAHAKRSSPEMASSRTPPTAGRVAFARSTSDLRQSRDAIQPYRDHKFAKTNIELFPI